MCLRRSTRAGLAASCLRGYLELPVCLPAGLLGALATNEPASLFMQSLMHAAMQRRCGRVCGCTYRTLPIVDACAHKLLTRRPLVRWFWSMIRPGGGVTTRAPCPNKAGKRLLVFSLVSLHPKAWCISDCTDGLRRHPSLCSWGHDVRPEPPTDEMNASTAINCVGCFGWMRPAIRWLLASAWSVQMR